MQSRDVYCQNNVNENEGENDNLYDPHLCRQHTWQALIELYDMGSIQAIGVANFEEKHMDDLANMMNMTSAHMPCVNQIEFHGYWHELDWVRTLQSSTYNVSVNSYSPLGAPDIMYGDWNPLLPSHPVAVSIGSKYNRSGAQVWLRWAYQYGVLVNPRSWNVTHQRQNMQVFLPEFEFELTQADMDQLTNLKDVPSDNKVCPNPALFC